MGLFTDVFGSAFGIGSSIAGSIGSHKALKKQKKLITDQQKKNRNSFWEDYYKDPLQRSGARALLTETLDAIKNRNKDITGMQAVMGGTTEATMADKSQNNEAIAKVARNITAENDARQDALRKDYEEQDAKLQEQLAGLEGEKASRIGAAAQEGINTAGNIANLFATKTKEEDISKSITT